jgi:hypothetical protein
VFCQHMLRYVMLCYDMSCHDMTCYVMLCYVRDIVLVGRPPKFWAMQPSFRVPAVPGLAPKLAFIASPPTLGVEGRPPNCPIPPPPYDCS